MAQYPIAYDIDTWSTGNIFVNTNKCLKDALGSNKEFFSSHGKLDLTQSLTVKKFSTFKHTLKPSSYFWFIYRVPGHATTTTRNRNNEKLSSVRWISIFGYLMTSLKMTLVCTKKNQYSHRLCGPDILGPCNYPMSLSVKVKCQPRNVWYETIEASCALEPRNVRWKCCRRLCWRHPWSGIVFDYTQISGL